MYTLVRHSMWAVEHFPLFRNGLQPIRVGRLAGQEIRRAGGLLFCDESSAWDAAEGFMYPGGDRTAPPAPGGSFRYVHFCRLPVFVPHFSLDPVPA